MTLTRFAAGIALILASVAAAAQIPAAAPGPHSLGGLSGMLGGAITDIAAQDAGNAAGVLGYCVKNNLIAQNRTAALLSKLNGSPAVAKSPGHLAGQQGTLQTGSTTLSMDSLKGKLREKLCGLVLAQAKSFL